MYFRKWKLICMFVVYNLKMNSHEYSKVHIIWHLTVTRNKLSKLNALQENNLLARICLSFFSQITACPLSNQSLFHSQGLWNRMFHWFITTQFLLNHLTFSFYSEFCCCCLFFNFYFLAPSKLTSKRTSLGSKRSWEEIGWWWFTKVKYHSKIYSHVHPFWSLCRTVFDIVDHSFFETPSQAVSCFSFVSFLLFY